jgi:hypothetical protein
MVRLFFSLVDSLLLRIDARFVQLIGNCLLISIIDQLYPSGNGYEIDRTVDFIVDFRIMGGIDLLAFRTKVLLRVQ